MNTWNLLATIDEYPRFTNKERQEIRMRCISVRYPSSPDGGKRKLVAEVPVYAFGPVALSLRRLLKHTRHIIFTGRIEIGSTGQVRLVATSYTHLPSQVQQAKDYITELYDRNEVLEAAELPIHDLLTAPGKITTKNPNDTGEKDWPISTPQS